jgi:MFS family permease
MTDPTASQPPADPDQAASAPNQAAGASVPPVHGPAADPTAKPSVDPSLAPSSEPSGAQEAAPAAAPASPPGAFEPLRDPTFLSIWSANMVSNIGTWMQIVGVSWEMTRLAPSPIYVALVSTANSLPMLLFSLAGGVLADRFDRRLYIMFCQIWMMLAAVALAVLAGFDGLTVWSLLALTFALNVGAALNGPGWQAAVPEIVGRRLMPAAVSLNSAGFNVARTIGPGIGGMLYAVAGSVALFAVNAATFVAVVLALYRWRRPAPEHVPVREGFWRELVTGLSYLRQARALHPVLLTAVLFFVPAAGMMSMLPLVAREILGLDAFGFGVLYSAFGAGAVLGAFVLHRLRLRFGEHGPVPIAMGCYAVGMAVIALVPDETVVALAAALGGVGWICVIASNNVAAQTLLPAWVRARGIAAYQMLFFGSLAVGGALWGKVAEWVGITATVLIAAGLLALSTLIVARVRVPRIETPTS